MQEPLPKPRVLVLDEERRTLRLTQVFLMRDYDVVACESAETALGLLEQEPFHVVVLSHHLQSMDVFSVAQRAREIQPHIARLLISASAGPRDEEMQQHGVACLRSPYHPAALLELMERLVIEGEEAAATLYPSADSSEAMA